MVKKTNYNYAANTNYLAQLRGLQKDKMHFFFI